MSHTELRRVRLKAFETSGDRDFELNWIGSTRACASDTSRLEVFARLTSGRNIKDAWVNFENFPLLVLGSRWRGGVMMGKPFAPRTFSVLQPKDPVWHEPARNPVEGRLHFGAAYPLSIDQPASPVLEVPTRRGEVLLVPSSEILRAHYLAVHRAIPSLLGRLAALGQLSSPALEAWHPSGTFWIDQAAGRAQIHRARFISDYQATCLAQLLFCPEGLAGIHALGHWAQQLQVGSSAPGATERRLPLPRVLLPYQEARWRAIVRPIISESDNSPTRYLVLQIKEITAPEPYQSLTVIADDDPREGAGGPPEGQSNLWTSRPIDPLPSDPVDIEPVPTDRTLAPLRLVDILPMNISAQRRKPIKPPPLPASGQRVRLRGSDVDLPVQSVSSIAPAPGHAGIAPLIFGAGSEEWPPRSQELQSTLASIASALDAWVLAHRRQHRESRWQALPDSYRSFAFSVRRPDGTYEEARQFLVVEVQVGSQFAYLVDAERRENREAFPFALIASKAPSRASFARLDTGDIEELVRSFESSAKKRRSWIRAPTLKAIYTIVPVHHPPRDALKMGRQRGFPIRIVERLGSLLGDPCLKAPGNASP